MADIDAPLHEDVVTVVVIGGGALIDSAKVRVRQLPRAITLVAVPTIWGSGAEVSQIAVYRVDGQRRIDIDESLVPDAVVYHDEFAMTVPFERALDACGDAWAHAIEGFASPLAGADLRTDLSRVIREMSDTDLAPDPHWFELSAMACAGQARSSVGLVHGLAHVLEDELDSARWHHAKLCRLALAPVLALNRRAAKWPELFDQYELDLDRIEAIARELSNPAEYAEIAPTIEAVWNAVLRDPSTRTNPVLVRKADLDHFARWSPQ
jgi:alcohol dehydrogenase class IV